MNLLGNKNNTTTQQAPHQGATSQAQRPTQSGPVNFGGSPNNASKGTSNGQGNMDVASGNTQIHPIFLTQQEPQKEKNESLLGWIDSMTRLLFEGFVKLVDILMDAIVQLARLGVWLIAIMGVIIIISIVTGSSEEFINVINSLLTEFGIKSQIAPKQ